MPFTLVHPVVTIPIRKYGLPFSALIIGSLTPDFNYFLFKDYQIGHTILGQFYFCLPVGILSFFAYHLIIKRAVIELLPELHGRLLLQLESPDLSRVKIYPYIFIALIIGSFSHITWDSFTHEYGFAVSHFSFLQIELLHTSYGTLKLYKVLQHGSTLIGGAIIFITYYKWSRSTKKTKNYSSLISPKAKVFIVTMITLIAISLSLLNGFASNIQISDFHSFRNFVGVVIKTFIPISLVLVILYSVSLIFYDKYFNSTKTS